MSNSICIVWPAHFHGSTNPESHVTALFIGHTDDDYAKANPDLRENLENFIALPRFQEESLGLFEWEMGRVGHSKDIPAMILKHWAGGALQWQYEDILTGLVQEDIPFSRTFGFRPHVTTTKERDPEMNAMHSPIHLEAPVLWWGDTRPRHPIHPKPGIQGLAFKDVAFIDELKVDANA
jgi:hypothetical protein